MPNDRRQDKLLYLLLVLYCILLPLIEYNFYEANHGLSGVFLIVAASLLGLKAGLIVLAYATALMIGFYHIGRAPLLPDLIIHEMVVYLLLALVVGFVVEHYKKSRNSLAKSLTEMQDIQEKLKYLSFHDKLTGLYNRAFFEEEIRRLDSASQLPLSIIIGDLNNLKLVNDTFGHAQGDRLLVAGARVLQRCCRREDIICRWGGDEFAVLLPRTDHRTSQAVCRCIREACREARDIPITLSISIGTATREDMAENIFETMRTAEDRMYRHKILESKSSRGSLVPSLQNLLKEKTEETVGHAARMNRYAYRIGRALDLSESDLHELKLLAVLHDLGKVAIPDSIILKAESLSEEEWEIMKQHPEIGYKITRSIPELAHISEKILYHHEWWNGKGYPRGLSGEEIPLLCRIIAIADAYDVMTSGRSYKKSLSKEEALRELKKYSGSHFEPRLVEIFCRILEQ